MKTDANPGQDVALVAALINRDLATRGVEMTVAVNDFTVVENGRYGEGRPDLDMRLTITKKEHVIIRNYWQPDKDRNLHNLLEIALKSFETIEALLEQRDNIVTFLAHSRTVLKRELAGFKRRGRNFPLLSSGAHPIEAGSRQFPSFTATIQILSGSLGAETRHIQVDDPDELHPKLHELADRQSLRSGMRDVLEQEGADGLIDAVAIGLLERSGCDIPDVLARLPSAKSGILDVPLGADTQRGMTLFWDDGVVRASAQISDDVSWKTGVTLLNSLPQSFGTQQVGRPIREVLSEEAFPPEMLVKQSDSFLGKTRLATDPVYKRFNATTGHLW